jgi:hypothetical protein
MANCVFYTSWPVGERRAILEAFEFEDEGSEPLIVVHARFNPELTSGVGALSTAEVKQFLAGYDAAKIAAAESVQTRSAGPNH